MSNNNLNDTKMNCANSVNGSYCNLERAQVKRKSNNNQFEFGSEFNPNPQADNINAPLSNREFEPNERQKPVSERTAWH